MKKPILLTVTLLTIISLFYSCDLINPPDNKGIILTTEDASCTEVWLNLKLNNVSLPTEVTLSKNDTTIITTNINSKDTTLYIKRLEPNQTYTFQTTVQSTNRSSNKVTVTTMDTTSHNYTWETFTFGGVNGSSVLKDVAIINENNIWAVGEIHTAETDRWNEDSTKWLTSYNAVHWDGNTWELKRIMFYAFCNQEHKSSYSARAVFSFNDGIVAITSGSQITYIVNGKQKNIECIQVSVNSIWGSSSKDFYVVGNGGNIAHYNGSSWKKIENSIGTSGTDINLLDVYGSKSLTIYIAGGKASLLKGVVLSGDLNGFEILKRGESISANDMFNPYFAGNISTIWVSPKNTIYFGGHLLYRKKLGIWETVSSMDGNFMGGNSSSQYFGYITRIRGTSENNIFLIGERNTVRHFNGKTWEQIGTPYDSRSDIIWLSVAVKENVITTVGSKERKAMIMILKK